MESSGLVGVGFGNKKLGVSRVLCRLGFSSSFVFVIFYPDAVFFPFWLCSVVSAFLLVFIWCSVSDMFCFFGSFFF